MAILRRAANGASFAAVALLLSLTVWPAQADGPVRASPLKLWGAADDANATASTNAVVINSVAVVGTNGPQIIGKAVDTPSNQGAFPPRADWNITLNAVPGFLFRITDDVVGVVTNDTVGAYRYDGTPLWNFTTNGSYVFQGGSGGIGIDPASFVIEDVPAEGEETPARVVLYIGSMWVGDMEQNTPVYAIDLTNNGTQLWQTMTQGRSNINLALFSPFNHTSQSSKTLKQHRHAPKSHLRGRTHHGAPATHRRLLYVITDQYQDALQAIDVATGALLWTTQLADIPSVVGCVDPSGEVVVGLVSGSIAIYNGTTGDSTVSKPPGVKGDEFVYSPWMHHGLLYLVKGSYVTAIDPHTWKVKFDHTIGDTNVISNYLMDDDRGRVFVCGSGMVDAVTISNGRPETFFSGHVEASGTCQDIFFAGAHHMVLVSDGLYMFDLDTKVIAWTFLEGQACGPTVYLASTPGLGGLVVVPSAGNAFQALVALSVIPGGSYWEAQTQYSPYVLVVDPSPDRNVVYAMDTNDFYAINTKDGSFNWTWPYPFPDAMQTAPGMALAGGSLCATTESKLVCVNADNGTMTGRVHYGASTGINIKTLGSSTQYILYGNDDMAIVVDGSTGGTLYDVVNAPPDIDASYTYVQPVSNNDFVLLMTDGEESGGHLQYWSLKSEAVNSSKPLWNFTSKNNHFSSPPVAVGAVMITGTTGSPTSGGDHLYAFARETGQVLWKAQFPEPPYHTLPTAQGFFVFTPSRVYRVSLKTGKVIWTSPEAPGLASHPHYYPHEGGVLCVRSGGIMYGFNATTGAIAWVYEPPSGGSFGANAVLVHDVLVTPLGSVAAGFRVTTGQLLFTTDVQGRVSATYVVPVNPAQGAVDRVIVFNDIPTDGGDNAVYGVTVPHQLFHIR